MELLAQFIKKTTLKQCENIDKNKLKKVLECDDSIVNKIIQVLHNEKVLKYKYSFDCPVCHERNTVIESKANTFKCQYCGIDIDEKYIIENSSIRFIINKADFDEYYEEVCDSKLMPFFTSGYDENVINIANREEIKRMNNKVFIVHGHDNEAKLDAARTLEKLGFDAIILHEQSNAGRTIIEKIEEYTDVCYAVVLYTDCDLGRDKNGPEGEERPRARQNVVFEHGYLISKLGRRNVCALVKGDIETPGDINGVVYIEMDPHGAWKTELCKNMRDVGLNADANKL